MSSYCSGSCDEIHATTKLKNKWRLTLKTKSCITLILCTNFLSSWTIINVDFIVRFALEAYCWLQYLHGNLTPSYAAVFAKQDFLLMFLDGFIAHKDIWLHHVLPFCVEQDVLLMLFDSCIACKDIWLLHVLPFCVQQDVPLMLLDGCIAHKNIWLLYVLPFCVQQDAPLMLHDGCIAHKDIWHLHVLSLCRARSPFVVAC